MALALGKTVSQLETEMPVAELEEWYERQEHKPLPDIWFMWRWLMASQCPDRNGKLRPDDWDVTAKKKGMDIEMIHAQFSALVKKADDIKTGKAATLKRRDGS